MPASEALFDPAVFSEKLFEIMKKVNPGIENLKLYEFRYGLDNLAPEHEDWALVKLATREEIESQVCSNDFYRSIQIKPTVGGQIVLDPQIVSLTNMLFVGLVIGDYPVEWVRTHFYFDVRGFYFLHRTTYFTGDVLAHLGSQPYRQFDRKQEKFESSFFVGYKEFEEANAELDQLFIESLHCLIKAKGTPIVLAIAGPTAAGKTEIVARLRTIFLTQGKQIAAIELDNFLTDRDDREARGIHSQGKAALHYELFKQCLLDICQGKKITTPRYDFIDGSSSHDLQANLKPGRVPVEVEPSDIVFIEGNFPFLLPEIVHLIGIKVVYLTDDPVRLKRKWFRDVDLRKKYEPSYFRNRFFKDQFIMAQIAYIPQMQVCDMVVDTTGAALWASPEIAKILRSG